MALTIDAIQRVHPAPCRHYLVTVSEDGVSREVHTSIDEMREGEFDYEDWRVRLILLWARYKLLNGATPASLVGQTVVS